MEIGRETTQQKKEIRENLVYRLEDATFRKSYLHGKKRNRWKDMVTFFCRLFRNKKIMYAHIGYGLFDGIATVLPIFIVAQLTEILGQRENAVQQALLISFLYCLFIALARIVARQIYARNSMNHTQERMQYTNDLMFGAMRMDFGLYENVDLMAELSNAHQALSGNEIGLEGIFHRAMKTWGLIVAAVILAYFVMQIHPLLVLLGIAVLAIAAKVDMMTADYRYQFREERMKLFQKNQNLNQTASDFRYGKDVRMFDVKPKYETVWKELIGEIVGINMKYRKKGFTLSPIPSFATVAVEVLGLYLLGRGYANGTFTVSQLLTYLTAMSTFLLLMGQIAESIGFCYLNAQEIGDLLDVFDTDLQLPRTGVELKPTSPVEVEFQHVSFRYPGLDRFVFEDLNFKIERGEKLALVGVNGAGKTTIVKLLTGLYLPYDGKVLIDGVSTADIEQKALFDLFGVVFQETEIPALTILEFVSCEEHGDPVRAEEALRHAGIWEKIESLPKGIHSPVTKAIEDDGVLFSGGENQKICIARALYKSGSQMMIMDEPTSALDALAEEKIYQEFTEIMQQKTSLFISHRLASTRFCDRILLLDGGTIEEIGTHEELMQKDGLYREMFLTQGKYYQEEEADE